MKVSTNLRRFHEVFGLKKTIDIFAAAGFEGVDFNTDIEEYHTDAHNADFYKEIKAYAADRGIGFYQTHAPYRCNFPEEEKTERRFWEIVKSMEHSALLGAEMTVVHPYKHFPNMETMTREQVLEGNVAFYKRLLPYAQTLGIKIAIENIHGYFTADADSLTELVETLDNDMFTVCLDVGHAALAGQDPAEMIRKLGHRLGCTHIHDNDGVNDLHTLPFSYSTIRWEEVMKALAQTDYTGNLNYEAGRSPRNAPEELIPESAKQIASVCRHLANRFEYYKDLK